MSPDILRTLQKSPSPPPLRMAQHISSKAVLKAINNTPRRAKPQIECISFTALMEEEEEEEKEEEEEEEE